MVKMLSRDLIKMENVSPALLHAERLTEIKAIVALAETGVGRRGRRVAALGGRALP